MSSTLAHAASASLIALTFAHAKPNETSYILAALVSASILDLDHLVYVIKDRAMYRRLGYQDHLHNARSAFHELCGLLMVGVLSGLLFWADPKLAHIVFIAFAIHVVQDWVMGKSYPLAPVDTTETQFFALASKQKMLVDMAIVTTFGILWILYLVGAV
jgi:hypothetical protein